LTGTLKFWGNVIDLTDGKPKKNPKPNETDSQTNIDIEIVNNIDFGFLRGVIRAGYCIEAFSARE
jgi:hypothetical protein